MVSFFSVADSAGAMVLVVLWRPEAGVAKVNNGAARLMQLAKAKRILESLS
jgi:hypothetical protein